MKYNMSPFFKFYENDTLFIRIHNSMQILFSHITIFHIINKNKKNFSTIGNQIYFTISY